MGAKVPDEHVVVCGEIADGVIAAFGTGVEDALCVVGEAGEMCAVLFGEERLDVFALFGVVELERFIVACCDEEFAGVVEIEGGDAGFWFRGPEELRS